MLILFLDHYQTYFWIRLLPCNLLTTNPFKLPSLYQCANLSLANRVENMPKLFILLLQDCSVPFFMGLFGTEIRPSVNRQTTHKMQHTRVNLDIQS